MTAEIFERACALHEEISKLVELEWLFMNSNENRELLLRNADDGHKVINRAIIPEDAQTLCLSAIRELTQIKRKEFEKL